MPEPIVLLTRRATFAAAHRLYDPSLDDAANERLFGKCTNPRGHGHNYVLEVTVRGEVPAGSGMLINLVDLKQFMERCVLEHVDHKHLNEDVPFLAGLNPTVEALAVAFWRQLEGALPAGRLYEVRLEETENNWAVYRGEVSA
jgi:6-pyruvoyltetrahydropterin/6-carboxytetrahydropterin synthase